MVWKDKLSLKLKVEGVVVNVGSGCASQVEREQEEKEIFWRKMDEKIQSKRWKLKKKRVLCCFVGVWEIKRFSGDWKATAKVKIKYDKIYLLFQVRGLKSSLKDLYNVDANVANPAKERV